MDVKRLENENASTQAFSGKSVDSRIQSHVIHASLRASGEFAAQGSMKFIEQSNASGCPSNMSIMLDIRAEMDTVTLH